MITCWKQVPVGTKDAFWLRINVIIVKEEKGRRRRRSCDMVVGNIDGPLKAWGCVIQPFLIKFPDEKPLVTDRPTDLRTNRPYDIASYRDAWTHLKTERS